MFKLRIRLGEDSAFWHEYLQIKDLTVDVGDVVEPGDVLGRPGDYHDLEHARVGFGVVRHQETFVRLCPSHYATPPVLGELQAALAGSNEAFGPLWPDPCPQVALACIDAACDAPESFVAVGGDIDRGRRRYDTQCATCHGPNGEGDRGDPLIGCSICTDQDTLAAYIAAEMPPGGSGCSGTCADDVAAFILWEFVLREG